MDVEHASPGSEASSMFILTLKEPKAFFELEHGYAQYSSINNYAKPV
jgi:hypothetical protein